MVKTLRQLRELGVGISRSIKLAPDIPCWLYLRKFPLSKIKVYRSFVVRSATPQTRPSLARL